MHRQVGDLILDEMGTAIRGLLVRHLVMPENLAGTEQIIEFIAEDISKNTYVNIMPHTGLAGMLMNIRSLTVK
jgi:putative pyruvate formate lyase activating enzyme